MALKEDEEEQEQEQVERSSEDGREAGGAETAWERKGREEEKGGGR